MTTSGYPLLLLAPSLMRYTVFLLMPCFLASIAPDPSYLGVALMSATTSALILVLLLSAPQRMGGGVPRPFSFLSAIFSAGVPSQRCLGFAHSGLSQAWQTKKPTGIGPFSSSQDTLFARYKRPFRLKFPYPPMFFEEFQPQHSSSPRRITFNSKTHRREQADCFGLSRKNSTPHERQLAVKFFHMFVMKFRLAEGR